MARIPAIRAIGRSVTGKAVESTVFAASVVSPN